MTHIVEGLLVRTCVGLPPACNALNDEAAAEMFKRILAVDASVRLLERDDLANSWLDTLARLTGGLGVHGLIAGRCCRLLFDAGRLDAETLATQVSRELSHAVDPLQAGAWLEGFLHGSGMLLLHHEVLWALLDNWVCHLSEERFVEILPLMRRTFGTFPAAERRMMGERVKKGLASQSLPMESALSDVNHERAVMVLPILRTLLGIE